MDMSPRPLHTHTYIPLHPHPGQVFPLCVVEGRLELSATRLLFFPERVVDGDDSASSTFVSPPTSGGSQMWVPDSASDVCGGCQQPILPGLFLSRKHHCRR